MKHRIPFAFLTLSMILTLNSVSAQGFKTDDPVAYNDHIVKAQNEIGEKVIKMVGAIQEQKSQRDVEAALNDAKETAKSKLSDIKKMNGFEGNTEFRDAAANLFSFYEQMLSTQYTEVVQLIYEGSPEGEEATEARLKEIFNDIQISESRLDKVFKAAQDAFAEEHEIELRENELDKILKEEK